MSIPVGVTKSGCSANLSTTTPGTHTRTPEAVVSEVSWADVTSEAKAKTNQEIQLTKPKEFGSLDIREPAQGEGLLAQRFARIAYQKENYPARTRT